MSTTEISGDPTARRRRFAPHPTFSRRNATGLVITFLLGLANVPSIFGPSGEQDDGTDGPPQAINVLDTICGLVIVVACVIAWRAGRRGWVRVAAGAAILQALSAVPAFFVDVPSWLKALVGVLVVLTIAGVVLMLSPERSNSAVVN
ncbi:MAG TPA: hypothetical protein VMZ00_15190 [Sporichthya sp.]|nr:hypothetical protein [Sporichthya sp.]